jgi:hypothetical protein
MNKEFIIIIIIIISSKLLATVHHQGLRLSLGAFRTSLVESVCVEANEPSLENRRIQLGMQYATK